MHSCNHHVSHIVSELGVIISQRVSRGVKALGQLGARVHDRRVGRRLGLLQRGIGCHLGLFEALLSKRLRLCKLVVETRVLDRRDEVGLRRVDERRRCSTELLGLRLKVSDRFCSRGTSGGERVKNESCVDQVGEQATRRAQPHHKLHPLPPPHQNLDVRRDMNRRPHPSVSAGETQTTLAYQAPL